MLLYGYWSCGRSGAEVCEMCWTVLIRPDISVLRSGRRIVYIAGNSEVSWGLSADSQKAGLPSEEAFHFIHVNRVRINFSALF